MVLGTVFSTTPLVVDVVLLGLCTLDVVVRRRDEMELENLTNYLSADPVR